MSVYGKYIFHTAYIIQIINFDFYIKYWADKNLYGIVMAFNIYTQDITTFQWP